MYERAVCCVQARRRTLYRCRLRNNTNALPARLYLLAAFDTVGGGRVCAGVDRVDTIYGGVCQLSIGYWRGAQPCRGAATYTADSQQLQVCATMGANACTRKAGHQRACPGYARGGKVDATQDVHVTRSSDI